MKDDLPGKKVQCAFDGKFSMPGRCVACGEPAHEKKWQITTTNILRNHKYIFKFPICDACADAQERYVNVKPLNIIGAIVLAFTVVSFLYPSTSLSAVLYYLGGVVWLGIVIGYLVAMNRKARRGNSVEVLRRNSLLKEAVRFEKIEMSRGKNMGQAVVWFANERFARDFARLNKGQVL
jgi:hypothetical protein